MTICNCTGACRRTGRCGSIVDSLPDSFTWPPAGTGNWHVVVICPYCGKSHREEHCPRVKSIEYHEDGKVKRVEFFEPTAQDAPVTITWQANSSNTFDNVATYIQAAKL